MRPADAVATLHFNHLRRDRRWTARLAMTLGLCTAIILTACQSDPAPGASNDSADGGTPPAASTGVGSTAATGAPIFTDITEAAGLDFVHQNGMTGAMYFVEIMGAGGAMVDYDNDGDLDLYLVQGAPLGPGASEDSRGGRLYRNDLAPGPDGRLAPRFTDVTAASGIAATGYGMGVAAGDYDNDGWTDLYLTNWGANQLWRNRGDGSFEDVTAGAGADDLRWSVSAAFLDYDRDSWLDLYIANYVAYSMANHHPCYSRTGGEDYCSPQAYAPERDKLLHNRGDGSFEDVTDRVGMTDNAGPGLGVATADFDGDGWVDIYVANDQAENFLWQNRGGQRFENIAPLSGAAVDRDGRSEASMGVNAADFDGDADFDLFLTHLRDETNTLYTNESDAGSTVFRDSSDAQPLGPVSLSYTGFGTADVDFDNDGWLDLAIVNGEVVQSPEQVAAGDPFPLKQTHLLFRNGGGGVFEDVTARGGPAFATPGVGRGLAAGDIDNDGDPDLLITHNSGPARLLRNDAGDGSRWLGLRLLGTEGRRDMLGAVARLLPSGDPAAAPAAVPPVRLAHSDGSYASARDPRVRFGLGPGVGSVSGDGSGAAPGATLGMTPDAAPYAVEITWPDGSRETWRGLASGVYHSLVQGASR